MDKLTDKDLHFIREARRVISDFGFTHSKATYILLLRELLNIIDKFMRDEK